MSEREELEALKAELERVRVEYQEFIYIVSHDLNAPPRKILAFSTRLQGMASETLSDKAKHYLDRIVANAQTMQAQMEALLRVSRCRPADDPAKISVFSMNELLEDLQKELEPLLSEAGAELQVEADLPELQGNSRQLQELFRELLMNSLNYARADCPPRIQLSDAGSDDHYCRLVVEDNGCGFEQRYAEIVFQIFQQLNLAEERHAEARIGAGLAIAQKAAETHGGRITATGMPGQGARFVVELARKYPHSVAEDTDAGQSAGS